MGSPEMIGATVAVYPLHTESTAAIGRAIHSLESSSVESEVGAMSTMITGTVAEVFEALRRAYEAAAATGPVVVHATLSNACPISARGAS